VTAVVAARAVSRFALADPHFILDRTPGRTQQSGFHHRRLGACASCRVLRVFQNDFGKNIFQIPIDERRRKLLAVDWVEHASVSRVWPNRIAVRIWERKPVAFVNLRLEAGRKQNSRLALIDAYGVILDRPEKLDFSSPILSGVYEHQSEADRQERIRHYLRLMNELGPLGKRVSEVDVSDPGNLRVSLEIERRAIRLEMGNRNFKRRLQDFLDHYGDKRRSGQATLFDLRLDDRITTRNKEMQGKPIYAVGLDAGSNYTRFAIGVLEHTGLRVIGFGRRNRKAG
jgi:cell division protein FtsQ